MKKLIFSILSAVLSLYMVSCNHEVFVKPLTVEPMTHTIEWTGGEGVFKANQAIDNVWITAFRWVNGKGMPLGDNAMQFSLHKAGDALDITNELCNIKMSISPAGEFIVNSAYNLFPDTIYLNLEISINYENVERGVRILPQPGFGHSNIRYNLQCWQEDERTDTIMLAQIATGDGSLDYTLKKKGDIVAKRAVQFKSWEKLLSDNIFGREPFNVDALTLHDYGDWLEPELSSDEIPYSSAVQHIESDPLLYDEDVIVKLEPQHWYRIRAIIKGTHLGVDYSIDAISPLAGLEDRSVEGVCWLSVPTSYTIDIESGVLRQ